MSSFTILAPHLERPHLRILHAMLHQAHISPPVPFADTWQEVRNAGLPIVASFGKEALDQWHDYGLIRVGMQRGNVFKHQDGNKEYLIMVFEHPGTLLQQSMDGRGAKGAMRDDLQRFKYLLAEDTWVARGFGMPRCAKCQNARVKGGGGRMIPASEWPVELDCVGLCDVHYGKRGQIKAKSKVKKRVDKSKPEAQMAGQVGMFPVAKK